MEYSYSYSGDLSDVAALSGVAGIISIVAIVVSFAMVLLSIIIMCKIFSKAGVEPWKAIIPIYNIIIIFQLVGMKPWLVVLAFIPCVNFAFFIIGIMATMKLVKCFGGSTGMAVAAIFFGPIVLAIIAFSNKYQYEGVV